MENSELFSEKITKGSRTYFFDVKSTEGGDLYLSISESKRTDEGFERNRILVFEEDFNDFKAAFNRVAKKLVSENKSYSLDNIREKHPQAYQPWSLEDDEKLETLFCEGKSVKDLAFVFERNEGAIRSRIKKLELKEKYG
ncbi:DUF3276 family protein [Olivibacter sp. XZL3]|uniref:DUF3276 family protein n=1 Tax=Olivibacter sp. XZL3 TaxID=1735116 RepID=UPI0010654F65|nr:DUF3276 family protein [Olivibacter sp. XZL3]